LEPDERVEFGVAGGLALGNFDQNGDDIVDIVDGDALLETPIVELLL
jgi:hypothetical protein